MAISPSARIGGRVFFGKYVPAVRAAGIEFSDGDAADLRWDLHAGRIETALVLAAAPETVNPDYKTIPVIKPPSRAWLNFLERLFEGVIRRAIKDPELRQDVLNALWAGVQDLSWILRGRREGYVGKPHLACAAEGEVLLREMSRDIAQVAQEVFAGQRDPHTTTSGAHLFRGLLVVLAVLVGSVAMAVIWRLL